MNMNKKKTIKWLKQGSIIYYYYLGGGIAISNPKLSGYNSVQWLEYGVFSELKREGIIKYIGKGNYTDIRAEKYQSYALVKRQPVIDKIKKLKKLLGKI